MNDKTTGHTIDLDNLFVENPDLAGAWETFGKTCRDLLHDWEAQDLRSLDIQDQNIAALTLAEAIKKALLELIPEGDR
jgi:hypothetical protein